MHNINVTDGNDSREVEILLEIKEAEKKAEDIAEKGRREKEMILREAPMSSAKLLAEKQEEFRKMQEKKTMDFREKAKLIREEKISEGSAAAKQQKAKAEKMSKRQWISY